MSGLTSADKRADEVKNSDVLYSPFLKPLLVSGTGMMALVFVALAPVLAMIADHLGGGTQGAFAAQMLMSTPAIGIVLGGPLWGWIVGHMGAPRALYAALTLYCISGTSGFILEQGNVLIASRFFLGMSVAGVVTTTSYLIGRLFAENDRERLFGIQGATGAGVALLGVWAAGLLGRTGGWHATFLIYLAALPMLVIAILVLRKIQLPNEDNALAENQPTHVNGLLGSLKGLLPFYLVVLAMSVIMQMTGIQTGLVLAEDGITDPGVHALVLGCASISGILVGLAYGRIRSKLSERSTAALILFFWATGQTAIGFSDNAWAAAAAVALSGVGSGLMFAFLPPALLRRVNPNFAAQALGLYFSTMFIGDFINPLIMGSIRLVVPSYHAVFITIGASCGFVLIILLIVNAFAVRRPVKD